MKKIRLKTDMLTYYIIRYLQKKARVFTVEEFTEWFVKEFILRSENKEIGNNVLRLLKSENDMIKMYRKLLTFEIILQDKNNDRLQKDTSPA